MIVKHENYIASKLSYFIGDHRTMQWRNLEPPFALCNDEYHFKILDVCNIDKQYARIPEDSTTFDFFTISETKIT